MAPTHEPGFEARAGDEWIPWFPHRYLQEYYDRLGKDEEHALRYLLSILGQLDYAGGKLLEFGCGPTVHRAVAAAPRVDAITFADLLPENLSAVEAWLQKRPGAYDWSAYTKLILELEGRRPPSAPEILLRENQTRARVEQLAVADAWLSDPLGPDNRESFDLVLACFCLETIGMTAARFVKGLTNTLGLVAPGGVAIVMTLAGSNAYRLGDRFVECYPVQESDIEVGFTACRFESVDLRRCEVPEHADQGYSAMLFATARRPLVRHGDARVARARDCLGAYRN